MSFSGMSRRTRILPQHGSNSAAADRRPDEEWSKKRAHSRWYLWLHRRHAFLNPQWRLLVFLMSCIIGTLCVLSALLRISNYHSRRSVSLGTFRDASTLEMINFKTHLEEKAY